MNIRTLFPGLLLLILSFNLAAQETNDTKSVSYNVNKETRELFKREGRFFLFWGYNRSTYSHSNMKFWGDGYNFRINDIHATDDATPLSSVYCNPSGFTVPDRKSTRL